MLLRRIILTCLVCALAAIPFVGRAYGPNTLDGEGDVIFWSTPVIYHVDKDTVLDCNGSSVDLSGLFAEAFASWENAPESALVTDQRTLPEEVDASNFCNFVFDEAVCPNGPTEGPDDNGFNPFIIDEDGSVVELFFAEGSRFSILGFAAISDADEGTNRALKGLGVINVTCFEGCAQPGCTTTFTEDDILAFITHEGGHFFGLNHTQVNKNQSNTLFKPTMFALFSPGAGANIKALNRDDEVSVAHLYPQNSLADEHCTVIGTIVDEDEEEFQCANVVVRNVSTTANANLLDAMSYVSGMDMLGGTTEAGRGDFIIKGLKPGNTYRLEVEPISTAGQLSSPASGIKPCHGGGGNPKPPTFDAMILAEQIVCEPNPSALIVDAPGGKLLSVAAGDVIDLGEIQLANTSGNVANESNVPPPASSGGCSLIQR